MAQYEYDLTNQLDMAKLEQHFDKLGKVLESKKFKSYIADKCLELLKEICNEQTFWEEHSVWSSKLDEYKNGHKVEIGNDYVLIFNDTYYSQDELWWLSPATREKYADGLTVSYLIEYGMGARSAGADDWQTGSKDKWAGYDPDNYPKSKIYSSQEGKFIYLKLATQVEQRIEDWILEYMERNVD